MRCSFAVVISLVLAASISVAAQHSGTQHTAPEKDDRCNFVSFNVAECGAAIREMEARIREMIKDSEDQAVGAPEKTAEELRRTAENLKKLRSGNLDQQIEGTIDAMKILNSHRDGGERPKDATSVSVAVTDQSLGYLEKVHQIENEAFDSVGKTVQKTLEPPSQPRFSSGQSHQLDERRAAQPQQTSDSFRQTINDTEKEALDNFAKSVQTSLVLSHASVPLNSGGLRRSNELEEQAEQLEHRLLSLPSAVKTVTDADRAWNARVEAARKRAAEEAAQRQAAERADKARREAEAAVAAAKSEDEEDAEDLEYRRTVLAERKRFADYEYSSWLYYNRMMQQAYSQLYPTLPSYSPYPSYGVASYGAYGGTSSSSGSGSTLTPSPGLPSSSTGCPNLPNTLTGAIDSLNCLEQSLSYKSDRPMNTTSSEPSSSTTQTTTAGSVAH